MSQNNLSEKEISQKIEKEEIRCETITHISINGNGIFSRQFKSIHVRANVCAFKGQAVSVLHLH